MRAGATVALAGVLLAAGAGWSQEAGMHQEETRTAIRLPAMQRDMVLTEMRLLLTSVNGILRGLSAPDTALMRQSAQRAGMAAMMAAEEPMGRGMGGRGMRGGGAGMGAGRGMGPMMPEGFRTLMHSTRAAFDSLADRIAGGATTDSVVGRLARITSNCVACHSTWRLEVQPP